MKFALNDEQQALADATKDFFASNVSSDKIRDAIETPLGYDDNLFRAMCDDLGLASLVIPEEYGGFGAHDVELAVVMEQHGYFLAPTPLRTHVSASIVVDECADTQYREQHLSFLSSGEEIAAALFDDDFTVVVSIESAAINGRFGRIPFGHVIKHLYFPCEVDGHIKLAYLDCTSAGVKQYGVASIDQTQPLGAIECENTPIVFISGDCAATFARARSRSIVAAANEMAGSTQAILDMAVSYAKDRVQFSRPIGSFQAIKHKCADMLLETESARSIALFGAWLASQDASFSSSDIESDLDHVASMAKYYCSHALSHAAGENIQIHGGIGFTMEHDAQLYFKRAAFMNAHLGSPHMHSELIAHTLRDRLSS